MIKSELIRVDCSNPHLTETCNYYSAYPLSYIMVYKDGEKVFGETIDKGTDKKIYSVLTGEKETEEVIEFDRAISPSPILIEPMGEPKKSDGTIVHDFDYDPTDQDVNVRSFGQDEEIELVKKRVYHPIDNPNAGSMPITHVFTDQGSSLDDYETYLIVREHEDIFNPFKEQSFVQAKLNDKFPDPIIEDQEIVYVPFDRSMLPKDLPVTDTDPGDVYYVFNDERNGHITSLEDLSTRDPNSEYRTKLSKTQWIEKVPVDEFGREIFPLFESYIPPINLLKDKRPLYEATHDRRDSNLIKTEGATRKDEWYIEPLEDDSFKSVGIYPSREIEPANDYFIQGIRLDSEFDEVYTKINTVKFSEDKPSVVDPTYKPVYADYDPYAVSTDTITIGRTGN